MIHEHCKIWNVADGMTRIICPHCRHRFHEFPSVTGDQQRANESKDGHARMCPGTPKCVRRY